MNDLQERIEEINKKQAKNAPSKKVSASTNLIAPFEELQDSIVEINKKDFWEYAYIVARTIAGLIIVAAAIKYLFN